MVGNGLTARRGLRIRVDTTTPSQAQAVQRAQNLRAALQAYPMRVPVIRGGPQAGGHQDGGQSVVKQHFCGYRKSFNKHQRINTGIYWYVVSRGMKSLQVIQ